MRDDVNAHDFENKCNNFWAKRHFEIFNLHFFILYVARVYMP